MIASDTYASVEGTPNGQTYLYPEVLPGAGFTVGNPAIWFGHGGKGGKGGYANLLMADTHVEIRKRDEVPVFRDLPAGNFRPPGYDVFWTQYPSRAGSCLKITQ